MDAHAARPLPDPCDAKAPPATQANARRSVCCPKRSRTALRVTGWAARADTGANRLCEAKRRRKEGGRGGRRARAAPLVPSRETRLPLAKRVDGSRFQARPWPRLTPPPHRGASDERHCHLRPRPALVERSLLRCFSAGSWESPSGASSALQRPDHGKAPAEQAPLYKGRIMGKPQRSKLRSTGGAAMAAMWLSHGPSDPPTPGAYHAASVKAERPIRP
jgi:hypothetical protein